MSDSSVTKSARKRLTWLGGIIVVLVGLIGLGSVTGSGASFAPKLALDLQGGTQIILAPQLADGATVTEEQLNQAVGIIRQRVDSIGVAESEVTAQGSGTNRQIVISVPGDSGRRVVDLVGQTAELRFRQVLAEGSGVSSPADTSTAATPAAGVNAEINAKYAALD